MGKDDAAIVSLLGVTPEQLIGYCYAGLIATLILAQIEPKFVKDTINTIHPLLTLIVTLSLSHTVQNSLAQEYLNRAWHFWR